jgi:hypothetical protein
MRKENYEGSCSVVIKRSPAVNGRKINKTLAASSLTGTIIVNGKNDLSKSVSKNINSIEKALKESNKIIPWANNISANKA